MTVAETGHGALHALFRPSSVAVVGASSDLTKPGGRCLRFLREFGFAGDLFAINPKYEEIDGVPCYPDLESAPAGIDLVVLLVPADDVSDAVRRAAARGSRAAIVCSSGFGESGPAGITRERELARAAAETGVAVVGPNSLGLLDMNASLAATFSTTLQLDVRPRPGPVALVSQSGAMGAAIYGLAQLEGVGVGTFVSTGNEAGLAFADYVRYLADLDETTVILGYVEGVRDGRALVDAARYARGRGTTVAVLKAGRTDAGARAAMSHTGALTGSSEVYDAAFRRAGILAARSPRELLDIAVACTPGRFPAGQGVGIASMSGGAGAIMSDRLAELGLVVTDLADDTKSALRDVLPSFTAAGNPVDYGGVYTDPDKIEQLARILVGDRNVDTLLCFIGLSPLMLGELDARLERLRDETEKPFVAAWLAGPPDGVATLRRRGIPAYEDPIRAAEAVAALAAAARPLPDEDEPHSHLDVADLLGDVHGALGERATKELLAAYGVPVVTEALATTEEEATAIARRFGVTVAVKVEADGLLHKSESGGVRLDVSEDAAGAAFRAVVDAASNAGVAVRGAVVQPMVEPGVELLVGSTYDPQFGPTVAVGLGGVASEALRDVVVELAPLTHVAAIAMLERLRGRALLGPFRGSLPRDIDSVAAVLVAVGRLAADAGPRLRELDCNPVVVHAEGRGCVVVDAAAVIEGEEEVATV